MSLTPRRRLTRPAAAVAAVAAIPASAATPPAPTYALKVVPVLGASSTMNGRGIVAGLITSLPQAGPNAGKPYVWSEQSGLVILPAPPDHPYGLGVLDINDNGWVLGSGQSSTTGVTRGFIWRPVDGRYQLQDLGHPPGKVESQPVGIDNLNRVVGFSRTSVGNLFSTPTLWSDAGPQNMVDLGYPNDPPRAISGTGWVATGTLSYRLGAPGAVSPLPALPAGYSSALTAKIAADGDRFVLLFLPTGQASVRLHRLDAATGTWTALWSSNMVGSVP